MISGTIDDGVGVGPSQRNEATLAAQNDRGKRIDLGEFSGEQSIDSEDAWTVIKAYF